VVSLGGWRRQLGSAALVLAWVLRRLDMPNVFYMNVFMFLYLWLDDRCSCWYNGTRLVVDTERRLRCYMWFIIPFYTHALVLMHIGYFLTTGHQKTYS
jgi:hypothetical protein